MIFIGDIAHPFAHPPAWKQDKWPWTAQPVVVNLEGALVDDGRGHLQSRMLFNHISIVDSLIAANVRAVNLANNHIMDVAGALKDTCSMLQSQGISFTGAGANLHEAAKAMRIVDAGKTYVLLGVGWETIQCRSADQQHPGVNPLKPPQLLKTIERLRASEPAAVIVIMPHWNYEMELYPQPAHRQLAMAAIDAGADAVIGHHPHRVGGIEIYKGHPIAYSLGNWWMPQGVYFNGTLRFGDETLLELALEWKWGEDPVCHWFQYCRETHQLIHIGSERLAESERIRQLTPFAGMPHKAYQQWFSKNRIKRKALPIYRDYRHRVSNAMKDRYVRMRHSALVSLETTGLRKMLKA